MSGLTDGNSGTILDPTSAVSMAPNRLRDNLGKLKVSESQNLFEADFEYGVQPMRWENYTSGGGTVAANSSTGGVVMSVTAASGDLAIRQTRAYVRYQPGKSIYMSSGFLFGSAYTNQRQRVGFFDDGNGVFFEQGDPTAANPTGMGVVYRSDVNGSPIDTRIPLPNWSDPYGKVASINWQNIQMLYVEYAWYGAGLLRWGVVIQGEPYILHQIGIGNLAGQVAPWARTGNIPVRYELRNVGASTASSMIHWGVSVLAEGKVDPQRGFTYGYGVSSRSATGTRYPALSLRYRVMGTLEYGVDAAYSGANGMLPTGGAAISTNATNTAASTTVTLTGTPLVANAWVGKYIFCRGATASITGITISGTTATATTAANPNYLTVGRWVIISGATASTGSVNGQVLITGVTANTFTFTTAATGSVTGTILYQSGQGSVGRITANTTGTLTVVDNAQGGPMPIPPSASANYILGVLDRGQILPQTLTITASAACTLELITSTYSSPVTLTGGTVTNGTTFATMYSTGSLNSFSEKDTTSTGLTGGEVVYYAPIPAGGLLTFDLSNFFPLYNNVQGNQPDILSIAITGTSTVSTSLVGQEAMS
jgi:hypothetical protein